MIDHGHPHCHIHEVEMMDHVKRSIAASYTSLLSRIDSHIEDNRVHVSAEEKDTWNNKADKTQIRDLEMRLTEKADYCDVIELKEILAKIKAKVENTSENGSGDSSDYITENELERRISGLLDTVADMTSEGTSVDLSNYYTKSDVYSKSEVDNKFYTKNEIDTKISIIPTQPGAASISYTNLVPSDAQGKYQIGTLAVNGTDFPVYQKDTAGSNVSVDGKTLIVDGTPYNFESNTDVEDLINRITEINGIITTIQNQISTFDSQIRSFKTQELNEILEEFDALKEEFGIGDFNTAGWNETLRKWVSINGLIYDNETGTWSTISQAVDDIKLSVKSITQLSSEDLAALEAFLRLYTENDDVFVELAALKEKVNGLESWMAGFKAGTHGDESFSEIFANYDSEIAALNALIQTKVNAEDLSATITAIASAAVGDLAGEIWEKDSNGNYVLDEHGNRKLKNINFSGLVFHSDLDSSLMTLIANHESGSFAAINGIVDANQTVLDAVAKATEAKEAVATLSAQNDLTGAEIIAKVNGDESTITINADKININGIVTKLRAIQAQIQDSLTVGDDYHYVKVIAQEGGDSDYGVIKIKGTNSSMFVSAYNSGENSYCELAPDRITFGNVGNTLGGTNTSTSTKYVELYQDRFEMRNRDTNRSIVVGTSELWGNDNNKSTISINFDAIDLKNTPIMVDNNYGATGSFVSNDGKTITVKNGIIVGIS